VGQPDHGYPCLPGLGHRDANTRVTSEEALRADKGAHLSVSFFYIKELWIQYLSSCFIDLFLHTVKLGYKELGYNEHNVQSQMTILLHKTTRL
jgi:hypothetical protein